MKKTVTALLVLAGILYMCAEKKPTVKNFPRPVEKIVAFGDSLTAGYGGGGAQNAYPAILANLSGKEVINEGLSGDTASHAPARLPDVLKHEPDMVLIEFGATDYMRGLSQAAAVSAVAQVVDAVQETGAVAVIVDTAGPGMSGYTQAYKKLAREKQAVFVPGIMKGIFYKPSLKSDAIHPNAKGYERVARHVYKHIKAYL